jgi:hypothetical protein
MSPHRKSSPTPLRPTLATHPSLQNDTLVKVDGKAHAVNERFAGHW